MKTALHVPLLGLFALLALAGSGCVVVADPGPPPPSSGTLSVFSSIEGSTHPSECDYAGAFDLEVVIYEGSSLYTTSTASCYDFEVVTTLPEGDFNADVTLVDGNSAAVSTTLTLDNLRIIGGTDLQIDIDFPTSALLP